MVLIAFGAAFVQIQYLFQRRWKSLFVLCMSGFNWRILSAILEKNSHTEQQKEHIRYSHRGTFSLEKKRFSSNNCWFNQSIYLAFLCSHFKRDFTPAGSLLPHNFSWNRDIITQTSQMGRLRHLEDKYRRQTGHPYPTNCFSPIYLILVVHNKCFPSVSSP